MGIGDNFLLCHQNDLICTMHIILWNEGEIKTLTISLKSLLRSLEMQTFSLFDKKSKCSQLIQTVLNSNLINFFCFLSFIYESNEDKLFKSKVTAFWLTVQALDSCSLCSNIFFILCQL